jgi:hypothetical protein
VPGHGTGDESVDIDKIFCAIAHEVFIGDIAPAGNCHHAVDEQKLVVHAVSDAPQIEKRGGKTFWYAAPAGNLRIEQSNLHVGCCRQAK